MRMVGANMPKPVIPQHDSQMPILLMRSRYHLMSHDSLRERRPDDSVSGKRRASDTLGRSLESMSKDATSINRHRMGARTFYRSRHCVRGSFNYGKSKILSSTGRGAELASLMNKLDTGYGAAKSHRCRRPWTCRGCQRASRRHRF